MNMDAYDIWMANCALKRIEQGSNPTDEIATLRANGYNMVANAVEKQLKI